MGPLTPDKEASCERLLNSTLYAGLAISLLLNAIILLGVWKENYCIVTTVAVLYTIGAFLMVLGTFTNSSFTNISNALITFVVAGLSVALSRFIALGENNSSEYDGF